MIESLTQRIQELLGHYSLGISVVEGVLLLQNDYETVGISSNEVGSNRLNISYFSINKRLAEITLSDEHCPRPIKDWYADLKKLKDIKGYVALPYFEVDLDLDATLEVCLYLGAKIAANEQQNRLQN